MEYQIHFGRKFYKDQKTEYWISSDYSKEKPRTRAHRWVWLCVHKLIPDGYHIHHINEDKSDNRIENLELIKANRHLRIHNNKPEKIKQMREMADKYRHLTKKWHASAEGKAWHRLNALKNNFGNNPEKEFDCEQCGKKYLSKQISSNQTRFCSNNCKSAWRRKSGIDNEKRVCEFCHSEFECNKYARKKNCSRTCAQKNKMKKNTTNN